MLGLFQFFINKMKSTRYISDMFPGYIIFLIDRSSANEVEIYHGEDECVYDFTSSLFSCCDGGRLPVCYISTIEYGAADGCYIKNGWIEAWGNDKFFNDTRHCVSLKKQNKLSDALTLANTLVKKWIKHQKNVQEYGERWGKDDDGFLGPIVVINLTNGSVDDKRTARLIASEIMLHQNTWLYNIVIKTKDSTCPDLLFPNYKISINPELEFLQNISSVRNTYFNEQICRFELCSYYRAFGIITSDASVSHIFCLDHFQIGDGTYGRPVDWMEYYAGGCEKNEQDHLDWIDDDNDDIFGWLRKT